MDRMLLNRAAVARKLGHSIEWFYRNSTSLMADGFPRPTLGSGKGERWDPAAVDRWLDSRIEPALRLIGNDPVLPGADTISAELAERARQLAEGRIRGGRAA